MQGYRISGFEQDANSRLSGMASKVCATEGIISTITEQFQDLQISLHETRNVVADLTKVVSERMDYLPTRLRDMVESVLRRILVEFCGELTRLVVNENVDRYSDTTSLYSLYVEYNVLFLSFVPSNCWTVKDS
jgi:hypothetical protein